MSWNPSGLRSPAPRPTPQAGKAGGAAVSPLATPRAAVARAGPGRGEVKERGLSLGMAGPGSFCCNGIITEGRASLSKHTRPPAGPLPGINIKDRCIVSCERALPSPSAPLDAEPRLAGLCRCLLSLLSSLL